MDEAAQSREYFYEVKRHHYPILANADIIVARRFPSPSAQFAEIAPTLSRNLGRSDRGSDKVVRMLLQCAREILGEHGAI